MLSRSGTRSEIKSNDLAEIVIDDDVDQLDEVRA